MAHGDAVHHGEKYKRVSATFPESRARSLGGTTVSWGTYAMRLVDKATQAESV